ncbi:TPA: DEAD/DEAH box helicase [Escherichia coli]|nr:DEAD/DEAH box helicase [Escherichia coli]
MMLETVTIARNAVTAKLKDPSREVKLKVQQILSYMVAGAENTPRYKASAWDGRSSFFDFRSCTFPAGFVPLVVAKLQREGHKINLVRKPLPEPLGIVGARVDSFPDDPRYSYQPEIVEKVVKHGAMIAQVATGGGKSRIAKLLYARIRRPTLFLTTRSLLMYQMKDSFEKDMGVECSVLGDGQFGSVNAAGQMTIKPMCVGMVQTLTARLTVKTLPQQFEEIYDSLIAAEEKEVAAFKRKHKALDPKKLAHAVEELVKRQKSARATAEQIKKEAVKRIAVQQALHDQTVALLSKFECVIMEEAHEASGNSYYDIMRHCVNAHYRLALTATPFMKEDEEANMRLMACCGPVGYRVTEKQLIDAGILAKPFFKYVTIKNRPPKLYRHTGWQAAYRLGVVECKERNELVVAEAVKAHRYGLSVMALVQHTAHGDLLKHMLTLAGLRVRFISGECDHATRKAALQELADKKIDVLIGTTILDVGVDVPATGMIILAGAGKAEVALRQRVGRGLRAKKTGPNVAFIVDFEDIYNDHLKVHFQQRHAIIAGTPGFAENIIPTGTEFNFAGLGFTPTI